MPGSGGVEEEIRPEWAPFERPLGRIQAHVIKAFLAEHVAAGSRVLDAGSGPGRFALFLAGRGCRMTLEVLSESQDRLAGVGGEAFTAPVMSACRFWRTPRSMQHFASTAP